MFQLAFPAELFQLRARASPQVPLLQLPNRRATPKEAPACSPIKIHFCKLSGGIAAHPRTPYAATPTGGKRRTAAPMPQ